MITPFVEVEQGPEWLARLAYDPPMWAVVVTGIAIAAVLAYIVWRVPRASPEQKAQAVDNLVIVGSMGFTTWILQESMGLPYAGDVALGVLLGGAIGLGMVRLADGWGLLEDASGSP